MYEVTITVKTNAGGGKHTMELSSTIGDPSLTGYEAYEIAENGTLLLRDMAARFGDPDKLPAGKRSQTGLGKPAAAATTPSKT